MFDTHCHLNFKAFKKTVSDVITRAHLAGVDTIVIPGTDVKTSTRAIEVSLEDHSLHVAVGIHPHHVYKLLKNKDITIDGELGAIESLINNEKVVAIGEIGMDYHVYEETVYGDYAVNSEFMSLQEQLFRRQIRLAIQYNKSLIIHNREAKVDMLRILADEWDEKLVGHTVFHCCEADKDLLEFAKQHTIYIGIDGDITYDKQKHDFISDVPLDMLVLETDAPYLLPEPLRSKKCYPNEPQNIPLFLPCIAQAQNVSQETVKKVTTDNAMHLFRL